MKTAGIIAEYNPFHNGHAYLIQQARQLTGADAIIVIMSGPFVQRGEPAIFDKYARAKAALSCGADLVLELPVWCATGSAEQFAAGAVAQLTAAGCTFLCFGSECGNLPLLQQVAGLLAEEPPVLQRHLQAALRTGQSYPAAVLQAVLQTMAADPETGKQLSALLSAPNNLLAIEYLKAICRQHSPLKPVTIQRTGQDYHAQHPQGTYSSASAIRNYLFAYGNPQILQSDTAPYVNETNRLESETPQTLQTDTALSQWIPKQALAQIQPGCALQADDFSKLLDYRRFYTENFTKWDGFSSALSNRLLALEQTPMQLTETALKLKTKQYTYSHISRALFHLLLDIRCTDMKLAEACGYVPYIRVLGVRLQQTGLLREIKANAGCVLVNKVADAPPSRLFQLDLQASHLYRSILYHKTGTLLPDEYRAGVILQ